jgi:very-short-patch-repair endonuclease
MKSSRTGIVTGQRVSGDKHDRARELRKSPPPEERILWSRLRAGRLGGLHFRRQQVISGFIVDFYCHHAALVIELDGPIHDESYDSERDNVLESLDLQVLRFKNEMIHSNLADVLKAIESAAQRRLSSPSL